MEIIIEEIFEDLASSRQGRGYAVASGPTYYPMYCSWCLAEGRLNRTGWSVAENSSGICIEHSEQMLEEYYAEKQERA